MNIDRRDFAIAILFLIVWAMTIHYAVQQGREIGYWEHEAEENTYACEVFT